MQRDPVALSTTHKKTPQIVIQLKVASVHNDDNHEPIQLFDDVIYVQQPW